MPHDGIDHTVSLWTGRNFASYPLSTPVYGSGDLPWYRAFGYWLPQHAFTLLLLLLLVLALLAGCTQRSWRRVSARGWDWWSTTMQRQATTKDRSTRL